MELISFNRTRTAIVLDVDGVLLPCAELGVARWNREHPDQEPMTIEEITGYGMIGKRTDEILHYYGEEDFYKGQRPYPGAQEFVQKLSETCDVYFLTAVPDNVVRYRSQQLKRFFPQVPKDHVFFGSVKERFVADFSLDDCPGHILAQYDSGAVKHPVIMRRPWNETLSGIMSVTDYEDFITFISLIQRFNSVPEAIIGKDINIVALVGPAGADKGALCKEMIGKGFERLLSYTTSKRKAEDSEGYIHVSVGKFRKLKEEGRFIETTSYCQDYYAISKDSAENAKITGKRVVTVVDICGAVTLKRLFGDNCLTVYVKRKQDALLEDLIAKHTGAELKSRLRWLSAERKNRELCDITVVNDSVPEAAEALAEFLKKE